MQFICYPKCSTCMKAQKWLDENKIKYVLRDIKLDNPSMEELEKWHKISGLPIKKMFNTSGLVYKDMGLKSKLDDMSDEEKLELLSSNGMLVKRPVIVGDNFVFFGFKPTDLQVLSEK